MERTPSVWNFRRFFSRRLLHWTAVALLAVLGLWLISWLVQRSLHSGAKKRAMQSWLDSELNADVSNIGDMTVRINLVRNSRLIFEDVEIEHPNPLFAGRFAEIPRMGAWSPPWAVSGIWPGTLELRFNSPKLTFEENDYGEWSSSGLMSPLAPSDLAFPFPIPKISTVEAEIRDAVILVRRRGYELQLDINAEVAGRAGTDTVTLRSDKGAFRFGQVHSQPMAEGSVGPAVLRFTIDRRDVSLPRPVAGGCEVKVADLPLASLPLFIGGIPLDGVEGIFNGLVSYQEHPSAAGALYLDGALSDAQLTVFGLPRHAPIRLTWPVAPSRPDTQAQIRMGPSGFGAFEINIPLDEQGRPRFLSMRGDVAALDGIPSLFTRHSRWPDWLSRTFPSIRWSAGSWLGFGWTGTAMELSLHRSTAGLNLSGEAEMMGGRVRIAMNPDQHDSPINIAAEKLDAQLLAMKISQMLPEEFRVHLTGAHANLTWRGYQSGKGGIDEWGTGLVFAKPVIDVTASGAWWRNLSKVTNAMLDALPEWGGGDDAEIREIAKQTVIRFDQMSIVSEREGNGELAVEFRAYGDAIGQATGMIEKRREGMVEGEFLLAGPSMVLDAVEKANPDFGYALKLLANDSMGLRVIFKVELGQEPEFSFPFLEDARRVHQDLRENGVRQP